MAACVLKPIIRYEIKTGWITYFSSPVHAEYSANCNSMKIRKCLAGASVSHRNAFWFKFEDFNISNLKESFRKFKIPRRTPNPSLFKTCNDCKTNKPVSEFYIVTKLVRSYCKECDKKRVKQTKHKSVRYRLSCNLRKRLNSALTVKSWHKESKFKKYIGCSQDELISHLEQQFQSGMTWLNYTHSGWHVDHIILLCSTINEEELLQLCHYTNLQPLWATDNLKKSGKKEG